MKRLEEGKVGTLEIRQSWATAAATPVRKAMRLRRWLLGCGIAASLVYIGMQVFVPMQWEGYSVASQTVSELSAIDAPTRGLWVFLGGIYTVLFTAFGWGVAESAEGNRRLRATGILLVLQGLLNLHWPPMHLRGAGLTLTDTLHIVWTVAAVVLMTLTMAFAAGAFGRRFRNFTIATLAVLIVFGMLTGVDGPRVAANLPTPWIGVWERISMAAFFVWMTVLAVLLLRREAKRFSPAGAARVVRRAPPVRRPRDEARPSARIG
jgi:hypothetical protein